MKEYREEQVWFFREMGRKMMKLDSAWEARETERHRLKERARQAQAAEEAGDRKGKYPRWTQ